MYIYFIRLAFGFIIYIEFTVCVGLAPKLTLNCARLGPGGEVLGSGFAGYVPLASQNPHPIIVYSVAN